VFDTVLRNLPLKTFKNRGVEGYRLWRLGWDSVQIDDERLHTSDYSSLLICRPR